MVYDGGPARSVGMGLLESTAMGLCSMEDPAPAAPPGGGGAAEIFNEPAPAAAPGDPPPAEPSAADQEWLGQFSAEGGDADNPSNRDWLKAKGFKSLDDVAKSYREAEHAIRNGGKFSVPGENAKPEEIAAYHKTIGVPDKPEGYEVKIPEGQSLDEELMTPLREVAIKAGVPKAGFEAIADAYIAKQLDMMDQLRVLEDGSRDELFKEWGGQKDAKMADVQNAMRALGLKPTDVAAVQRGFAMQYGEPGSKRTLELLQKLGAGLAEDTLLGGDGARRFGITGEQAQAEIDKLIVDKDFQNKLTAKDPDAKARWDRLNAAVAADRDRKERAAAAG